MNIDWKWSDVTDWFKEQFQKLFEFLTQLVKDAILWLIEAVLDLGAWIVEKIPVPDWMEGLSIASMLGDAGPTIAWCISTFRIAEGFVLIGAAYAFRLLRKLLTLGQW